MAVSKDRTRTDKKQPAERGAFMEQAHEADTEKKKITRYCSKRKIVKLRYARGIPSMPYIFAQIPKQEGPFTTNQAEPAGHS